jgi:hypothetical protein
LAESLKEVAIGKVSLSFTCHVTPVIASHTYIGFSPDPVLTGVAIAETIKGIQDAGVIACAKHFIVYEQEHFRQPGATKFSYSSNLDDKTMHELYLWYVELSRRINFPNFFTGLSQMLFVPVLALSCAPTTKSTTVTRPRIATSSIIYSRMSSISRALVFSPLPCYTNPILISSSGQ